jgi:K+-sensing histidine kinase KdpD
MRQAGLFSVPQVRSWSWRAFGLAFTLVAISATFQGAACVAFGTQLYFAAFLPAIFVVGLLAGVPAAVFASLLSIPLVWWAFIPPFFEFSTLSRANAESINLFFLLAVLLIGLADLCRQTIAIISRGGLKPTDEGVAPNSQ